MKRILFTAIAFFALSVNAFANDWCNSRGSQQAVADCYRQNIQMENSLVTSDYQRLVNSPKYSTAQRQALYHNQLNWEKAVRTQCRNDICVNDSYWQRHLSLNAELRRIGQ